MFENLLVATLEVIFWCFLILTVLSIDPADAKYINWFKSCNDRRIMRTNEMDSGKWILSRTPPIMSPKVVIDGTLASNQISNQMTSVNAMGTNQSAGKRFILYNELAKLKYSNDLRKICHYNQINKIFNETVLSVVK